MNTKRHVPIVTVSLASPDILDLFLTNNFLVMTSTNVIPGLSDMTLFSLTQASDQPGKNRDADQFSSFPEPP